MRKLTVNNEQCIVAHSPCFCEQYFVQRKNGFVTYSLCLQIVYSRLKKQVAKCEEKPESWFGTLFSEMSIVDTDSDSGILLLLQE